jgi:Zn-dependent M28 family amino/carboxypeptidase
MTNMRRLSFGMAIVVASLAAPPAFGASQSECHQRINNTAERLLECIKAPTLWQHLIDLQNISDANPGADGHGNRDTGTAGYMASVQYVTQLMQQAGYQVQVQSYQWKHTTTIGTQKLAINGRPYREAKDWFVAGLSGSGAFRAAVAVPSEPTGCARSAFGKFRRGAVALLKRGACDFDSQVASAQGAGASAVIFYNDRAGVEDDGAYRKHAQGGAFRVALTVPARIPVIGALSYAAGASLAAQSRSSNAAIANIAVHTKTVSDVDYNVIADSPFGDADHTVVVEGHLDSIYGAGILDNGSGSSTILEIALNLANTPTTNRLRYIWFGGEELGLLGSKYYTQNLSKAELEKLVFDIDVDVTATPNYEVLIADPGHANSAKKFPPNVIPDSQIGNREFLDYFQKIGIPGRIASFGNDGTDSLSFSFAGVPNTGILTQQNCCKHDKGVRLWGGVLGNFEGNIPGHDGGCVDRIHRWCDNLSNNNVDVFEFASDATASVVLTMANDDTLGRTR